MSAGARPRLCTAVVDVFPWPLAGAGSMLIPFMNYLGLVLSGVIDALLQRKHPGDMLEKSSPTASEGTAEPIPSGKSRRGPAVLRCTSISPLILVRTCSLHYIRWLAVLLAP